MKLLSKKIFDTEQVEEENGCVRTINSSYNGTTEIWIKNKLVHRENGPAFTAPGVIQYAKNGRFHREDGPAQIEDGKETYWFHGHKINKEDLLKTKVSDLVWLDSTGNFHRENGPAFIGTVHCSYYINGRNHRTDGPAVQYHSPYNTHLNEYWINGVKMTKEEFEKKRNSK